MGHHRGTGRKKSQREATDSKGVMQAESVWLGVSRREKAMTLPGTVVTSLTEGDGRGTGLGDYVEVEMTGDWLEGGNALRAPGNSGLELRIDPNEDQSTIWLMFPKSFFICRVPSLLPHNFSKN